MKLSKFRLFPLAIPIIFFLLFPITGIIAKGIRETPLYFNNYEIKEALKLSLMTSTISVILIVTMGTPLSYIFARKNFPGKKLLEVLIDLPAVLPPTVAGIALLIAFGRNGIIGSYLESININIAFTPLAVIMAQMFVSSPYYIKSASAGFSSVSKEVEQAARVDGAHSWQVLRYITIPLALRSIITGMILCWVRALGEFGATIIFAGNYPGRTQTMPLAIYIGFQTDINKAITLGVILLIISFTVLFLINFIFNLKKSNP